MTYIDTKVYEICADGKFLTTIREISEFCAINKFKNMYTCPDGKITATLWEPKT
tara:strand:- start:95 stop:256 length:162 start_codon:yes stop_codon:yes gene_type:complete